MAVNVKTYDAPPISRREALRYAGVKEATPEIEKLLEECLRLMEGKLRFQVCWAQFPVARGEGGLDLGFTKTTSRSLAINLQDCDRIILFAATIGMEFDRLIAREKHLSPARAHMLQAVGVERIESLCDLFNDEITQTHGATRPRFSPGYGDVPLQMQRDVVRALDCQRKIGIVLNENLMMSPSKSVTAIIGIRREA